MYFNNLFGERFLNYRAVSEFMSQKLDIITLHGIEAEKG
jgi:hypothetical protein